jgi:hypothetical protein
MKLVKSVTLDGEVGCKGTYAFAICMKNPSKYTHTHIY